MNTLFDIAGECRHLSDREVIYNITNSDVITQRYEELLTRNEFLSVETLFEELTPGRRTVAMAAVEMYKRMKERSVSKVRVMSSQDIYNMMVPLVCDLQVEEFWLILCNQASYVIKKIRLSAGGIDGTYVDVRVLLRQVIMNDATSFAIVHNHPSGNQEPSEQDKRLTFSIKQAAETMQVRLMDHVIVCDRRYYSFSDEGMI